MELSSIINIENGRIFVLDPECFLIFTGDSLNDEMPFIRIGNWSGLPSDVLPMIENIIITDTPMGDLLAENQESNNKHMHNSRYIGSSTALRDFIALQEKLGLRIENSQVIEIERDIPELSTEKYISNSSRFIGVFCHNGNFKIEHNSRTIFELGTVQDRFGNYNMIHDHLAEQSGSPERYRGSGIVIMGHAPFIYHNSAFMALSMPDRYPDHFLSLGISPDWIEAIMLQDENPGNISYLLRWKGIQGSNIALCGKTAHSIKPLSEYYSLNPVLHNLDGQTWNSIHGSSVRGYQNSRSLSFTLGADKPSSERLKIAFMADAPEIRNILNDRPAAIFLEYSVYEKINLLFKSTDIPVLIIDDGNPNVRKLTGSTHTILRNGFQYEFIKAASIDSVLESIPCGRDAYDVIKKQDKYDTRDLISGLLSDLSYDDRNTGLCNICPVIRLIQNTTDDRSLALRLNDIYLECSRDIDIDALYARRSEIVIELIFFNNSVYEVIRARPRELSAAPGPSPYHEFHVNGTEREPVYNERIFRDRERLKQLVDLLRKNRRENTSTIAQIGEKQVHTSPLSAHAPETDPRVLPDTGGAIFEDSGSAGHEPEHAIHPALKPGIAAGTALIITAALLILLAGGGDDSSLSSGISSNRKNDKTLKQEVNAAGIKITDTEIYNYANSVARKNGYQELSFAKFKTKNPHWIYPGNMFIMPDGEKITVRQGDTLWKLSERKLMEIRLRQIKK